jgi:glycosyltransferase involved in cell wall biosynthesis
VRVVQYLPDLVPHDAISDHARRVQTALRAGGHESTIRAAHVDRSLRRDACRWDPTDPRPDREVLALYHASTGSPMAAWLADRGRSGQRIAVDYHNITPARYFDRWLPAAAERCRAARRELLALAPLAGLAVADSGYNEAELGTAGYAPTATCPLLVDLDAYRMAPDERTLERLEEERAAGGGSWLFVGRVAPNKCQHDVIAAFAVYRRLHDPGARLTLVGGPSAPRYLRALQMLCAELGVADAVTFLAGVAHRELLARFRTADVFVCLSEHEGFCVPLLEAMVLGTPIVAYAAAAVPETVGLAGALLDDKDPLVVAEAVADLLGDPGRRAGLVDAGRRRAEEYSLAVTSKRLVSTLERLGG